MLLVVMGCNQQTYQQAFIGNSSSAPKEEVDFCKQYLALFQSRDFDAIERNFSPELKNVEQYRLKLEQMANFFPDEKVKNIFLDKANFYSDKTLHRYNLSFFYEFPSKWLFASVKLEKKDDQIIVKGVHVQPLRESPEITNRFTFQGKGPINYIFLPFAILVEIFIIFTFVLCMITSIPKRKWLWAIFILLGFFRFDLNWTTGALTINPGFVQVLGSGFLIGGVFGPWIIQTSLPLGAIIFILKRKKWLTPPVPVESYDNEKKPNAKIE